MVRKISVQFFGLAAILWALGSATSALGQTPSPSVQVMECVNWDLEKTDPEIAPYVSKASGPVYFDFQRIEGDLTTRLIPHFNRDTECRDKPALDMFYKKGLRSIDHPLFPRGTGPIIEFEKGKDYKTDAIDILDLIEESHFVRLPGKSKITIRKSISGKHDAFEFPVGASLIHKVALLSTPTSRPLEMRMLVKSLNGWVPVLYLPGEDPLFKNQKCAPGQMRRFLAKVVRNHDYQKLGKLPGYEGSFARDVLSQSIRDLGWFESSKYGKMRMTYPVVAMDHCVECHRELGPARNLDLRMKHSFVRAETFEKFAGRSFHALNSEIGRLDENLRRLEFQERFLRGKHAKLKGKTPRSANAKKTNDDNEDEDDDEKGGKDPKVCGPDGRNSVALKNYRLELAKFLLPDLDFKDPLEAAEKKRLEDAENRRDVPEDWPPLEVKDPKKIFPKTLQGRLEEVQWKIAILRDKKNALNEIYNAPEKQIGKANLPLPRAQGLTPCGFVDLADSMPFNADLVGFSRSYQKTYGSKPFEGLNPRECTMAEVRVGERVWIPTPVLNLKPESVGASGPRSKNSVISTVSPELDTPWEFVVTQKLKSGIVVGELVDKNLSRADQATEIVLSPLANGDIAIEVRLKDGRDAQYEDNFAFVGLQGIMKASLKYLSCLDAQPVTPHETAHSGMGMKQMSRDMEDPFRFSRGANFFNIHAIHNVFGVGVDTSFEGGSSGHYMMSFGRRLNNRWAVRGKALVTPDRWTMKNGVKSPWTFGEGYWNAMHPHGPIGDLEAEGCFQWNSTARSCVAGGFIGDAPHGLNVMRNSNQNLVIKEGGPHHALEVSHAYQLNPLQLKTVMGKWRFELGVFSGYAVTPFMTLPGPRKFDSGAGRVQYDWKTNTFGVSYAHVNAQHGESAAHSGDGAIADPHGAEHGSEPIVATAEKPTLERSFNAWHEGTYTFYHQKLKLIQYDVTHAFALSHQ
ncbi:MAG: hypothetical protein K2X47_09550, partial [Bdellovibrionales bacterium]|nr:hypothetical protein [Bdellovibrionales bacterium]